MTLIFRVLLLLEKLVVSLSALARNYQTQQTEKDLAQALNNAQDKKDTSELDAFFKGPKP